MSVIDNAIANLQDKILACTTVTIRQAPDYPVPDATMLPIAITHLTNGEVTASNGSMTKFLITAQVDVHFARNSIKDAYQKIDALAIEFLQRLAGDPTLGGTVETVVFPVLFDVSPTQWDNVATQMISFTVQFKGLLTPITA